jgi:hypothetical protein
MDIVNSPEQLLRTGDDDLLGAGTLGCSEISDNGRPARRSVVAVRLLVRCLGRVLCSGRYRLRAGSIAFVRRGVAWVAHAGFAKRVDHRTLQFTAPPL